MSISFVSAGNNARAGNGNVTPDLPPGWIPDDVFICAIASRDNVNSTISPGWVAIDTGTNNGANLRTTTFYKIAISGDTNPTIIHPDGNRIEATIVAYRGVDTTNPFDVIGAISTNPYSTTITSIAITTLTDTSLVIFTGSIYSRSRFGSYSGVPTPIERIDVPNAANYPSTFVADFIMSPVGSTGNRTCIATVGEVNNSLMFALRPATATIIFITDPSSANIYINGILQTVNTSTSISVLTGNYIILLYKAGYFPYIESVTLTANQIIKISAILTQIANITDKGIVICTGSNISTCPVLPISCPILTTPLDYVNLITIITSIMPLIVTVRFIYNIDNIINNKDINVNLMTGTNIIYAFNINQQYPVNTILSLEEAILI